MTRLLLALAATGCVAAIPPPVDPAGLPACSAGAYGLLSPVRCEASADCTACDVGGACEAHAAADTCTRAPRCSVACCEGRCVVLSEPAELDQPLVSP